MPVMCCSVSPCDSGDCLQLTEREAEVCMAICASPEPVAFSAVKRALGYHQEVLSRILRRLVNYGAIEKDEGMYRRASQ
jgi:DNA-binding HxlR family transcriptional regulator